MLLLEIYIPDTFNKYVKIYGQDSHHSTMHNIKKLLKNLSTDKKMLVKKFRHIHAMKYMMQPLRRMEYTVLQKDHQDIFK